MLHRRAVLLRDGVLHALTHMRAQSAFGVLPYDAFLFMALQCLLANRLGAQAGSYRHHAGTFHLYESECEQARRVIDGQYEVVRVGSFDASDAAIKDALAFEGELRRAAISGDRAVVASLASGKYDCATFWGQAKVVLLLHALKRLSMLAEAHALNAAMPPGLKTLTDYDLERAAA